MALTWDELYEIQNKNKKKKKKEEEEQIITQPYSSRLILPADEIAPVKTFTPTTTSKKTEEDEEEKRTWFKKGSGNIVSTILGTVADIGEDIGTGIIGMGEKTVDALTMLGTTLGNSQMSQLSNDELAFSAIKNIGKDKKTKDEEAESIVKKYDTLQTEAKKGATEFVKKDLYDEAAIAKKIITTPFQKVTDINVEESSVLGDKSDSLIQSGGQLLATAGLSALGVPWFLTTGATSFGAEAENALNQGATFEQATMSAAVSAGAEILTEKLSGGIKFGGKTLDDVLLKPLTEKISSKALKTLVDFGVDAIGEGTEEVVSGVLSNLGTALYKEEDLSDILFSEEAIDEYIESFIGGAALGGFSSGVRAVANRNAIELTEDEQKVFDKVVEDRITEATEDGKKTLSKNEETKIRKAVLNDMLKGYIDTDTIESVLGGEEYEKYKKVVDSSSAYEAKLNEGIEKMQQRYDELQEEYSTLNKMKQGEMTGDQLDRRADIKDEIASLNEKIQQWNTELEEYNNDAKTSELKTNLKTKLGQSVSELVKDSRLAESYREVERNKYKYEADTSKYENEKAKQTVQNAIDSGLFRNTNADHDAVDLMAKASSDIGVVFKFTTNEKIKNDYIEEQTKQIAKLESISEEQRTEEQTNKLEEMKEALVKVQSGKLNVNGNTTNGVITINLDSVKPVEFITGHEILHNLVKSKSYINGDLQKAFKSYLGDEEYARRLEKVKETYKGNEVTPEEELMANLVGEYVFNDYDFVMHLATNNQNIFQKAWDSVKHLYNMATAGSKEARQLEKVKHQFEKAYKEAAKVQKNNGVDYSLSGINKDGIEVYETSQETMNLTWNERKAKYLDVMKNEYRGRTAKFVRNGHTYYAQFDQKSIKKPIYGDARSSPNGVKALIKTGADGDVFDLVENSQYDGSKKNTKNHTKADYFDYFIKTVQIDGKVFDLIADVEKEYGVNGGYVYTLALKDNKNIKASPTTGTSQSEPFQNVGNASITDILPQNSEKSSGKTDYSLSEDSEGKELTKEQSEYFKDSKAVDEKGSLKVVYHGTRNADFTVFKRNATYFTDSKEMADSYSPNGAMFEGYVNITKPYEIDAAGEKWSRIPIDNDTANFLKEYGSSVFKEGGKWRTTPADIASALEEAIDNGDVDYDGIIIKNIDDTGSYYKGKDNHLATDYIVFNSNQFKKADNKAPTTDPDIRFSLSENVEETKDLMALHNLHSNELMKQLEMGGIPYPSVAVTKPDTLSHEGFGDITLILNKDAIDPKKSKYNKLYSADAYTPTFPNVQYEASRDVANNIADRVKSLYDAIPEDYKRSLTAFRDFTNIDERLNSARGEEGLIERYLDDYSFKQLYLAEKGEVVPTEIKRTETQITEYQKEQYQFVVDKLGAEVLEASKPMDSYTPPLTARVQWYEQYGDALKNAYADYWCADDAYTLTKEEALEIANSESARYWVRELKAITDYMKTGGITVKEEADIPSTNALIDEKINDAEYKEWLTNLFSGIEGSSGIRNGKDLFTPSGKRRSFSQLHDPVTIDNVIKVMRKQGQTGQGAFGTGNIQGASTQEFGSIAEMKANSNRLGVMDEAEHKEITQQINDRIFEIAERYSNGKDLMDAQTTIVEAVSKNETKAGIARYLKQFDYVYKYTDSIGDDIIELRDYIRSIPTPYFEAKPQRAVSFDEVAAFVIPRDADIKVKQELLNKGYSIAEYDPKIEGDRQRVVNSFEKYKFSLSDTTETSKGYATFYGRKIANRNIPLADVAPTVSKTEKVAPSVAEKSSVVGTVNEEDYAPMTEAEAEAMLNDNSYINSFTDADMPPEMDAPLYSPDTTSIDDKALNNIAKTVKDALSLTTAETKAIKDIIQKYSTSEHQSESELFEEIRTKFGEKTWEERNEEIANIKQVLKGYKINVSPTIKRDITDYAQFRRRNFGKITFSKEGMPVDTAYMELSDTYPGLFPASITNATDQLLQMAEVANMEINETQTAMLDDESIQEATDLIVDVVNTYKENETLKGAKAQSKEFLKNANKYAKEMPVIADDFAPVGNAKNATTTEQATPTENNEAEEKPTKRSELHRKIVDEVKNRFAEKGFDFDKVLNEAKNLATIRTVDNTPQRVMEKALGYKQGQILADETVNKVAQNESEGIKWLNSFTDRKNGVLVQISKQYNIKPGSKKSAAAQMYAEGFYVDKNNEIIEYGDRELAIDFPDVKVQENIKGLAKDPRIRQIYDETLAAINESRSRNLYPEIQRLDNYFLHFRAMEDTFSRLGLPFNPNDIRAKDLPTDLNGVTADLKPGQPYFASAMHREGMRTSFDLLGGLEKYLTSAKNQIYHIDDIQTLRALRNYIADTYGQAKGLESLDELTDEEAQYRIEQVYSSHLSTFAKFLNEEANVLAGKTALIDRGLEGIIGRRGITFLNTVNGQVGSNMVGWNISSSLTNILPVVQTMAKTNKFDFVKALAQTSADKISSLYGKSDGFKENSPVIIRRKGAERFYRTPFQKVGDAGYILMSAVDDVSTEIIARTKYNELTRKGMDSQQAHFETDKWVSRLMGDRSLGQQPQLYNSKMLGLVTKFQLEVRNQLDSQFYDTIQEAKVSNEEIENTLLRNAKTAAKVGSTFFQLAALQHIFGTAFESVAGYNPAFDIVEILIKTLGLDDDEEDEDTPLDNLEEGFLALLEDLPYTSTLTGGRIPISSALPIKEVIKGEDQYGNEVSRFDVLKEAAPYYLLPTGYGQIKKTAKGLGMFSDDHPVAGSYTDSGNLRFPVEDNLKNRIQAGVFGQYANENARYYFDNEISPLKEKQIQEYADVEMPIKDYWQYREDLKGLDSLEEKFDFIAGMDLPVEKKNILINNIVDRKEAVDLENYDDFENYEEFDFYTKNTEKYKFLQDNGVSYKDYKADDDSKEKYDSVYSWWKNNPEKVTVSKAVTDNVIEYREYTGVLNDIRADKDENGKSISGSAKEKKQEYIWNLNIDEGAKYVLFKSEYNADDTYNYEILDYLFNRDDLTYEEVNTICEELGFKVNRETGYISWD